MARADAHQVGYRVEDDHRRTEFLDFGLHGGEVSFKAEQAGAHASELQQALLDPHSEVTSIPFQMAPNRLYDRWP